MIQLDKKAVFIDRDGVINSDEGHYYIHKPEDFVLNEGIIEGLKLLQDAGFVLIIITNQGGIAKGLYTSDDMNRVHELLIKTLSEKGITITDIFYCPHHDSISSCSCRKPKPGMIFEAIKKHFINPKTSYLIGDSDRDIEAGNQARLKKSIKIQTNHSIIPACKAILNDLQK